MANDDWLVNGTAGWTVATDWSTGSVPASGDDVLIGVNNHEAIVKSAVDETIHTLEVTSGNTLQLNGGNFNVTDGLPFGNFGFIQVDSANFQIDGGTINNSATIDLTPSGNITTDLTIFNTVQLNGAGSIVFAGNGNDGILGGTPTASLTNFDNNISGTGFIEGLVFINRSTIETNNDLGAGTLDIVGSADGGSFDNEGSVFADNNGTIELGLSGSSSTIINNNLIEVRADANNAHIAIADNVTITGNGTILLAGRTDGDYVYDNGQAATLNLDGGLLAGAGHLGSANLTLNIGAGASVVAEGVGGGLLSVDTGTNTITNAGEMKSDGAAVVLDIDSNFQNSGGVLAVNGGLVKIIGQNNSANTGAIQALGGTVVFYGSITNNGGIIQVSNGGEIQVFSSILGLNGGQIEIGAGGLLDLGLDDLGNAGTISQGVEFTGAAGTLELDENAGQIGTDISGLTVADSVDLRFLSFATGDHAVWTQTSGGEGTISIEAANNSLLANLVVEGTWNSQDFTVTPDDNNGAGVGVEVTVKGGGAPTAPADDFTGAGTSDLLLADGNALADWLVQNATVTQGVGIGSTGGWSLVGTGNFTGTGGDDLLLHNGSSLVDWVTQNGAVSSGAYLTNGGLPVGWNVIGTGDFNGDGTSDLLLQSGSTLVDWTVENGALQGGHTIGSLPTNWNVIATGDFNGDGTTDLLLQDGSNLAAWYLQNGTYAGGALITSQLPTGWSVVGTGDFNGDGTTDLLLQDGTQLADWTIKNGAIQSGYNIGPLPAGWSVAGTGDYNGDGTSDLLLQNGTQMAIWTMQNGQAQHGYTEPSLPAGWTIVPSKGLVT